MNAFIGVTRLMEVSGNRYRYANLSFENMQLISSLDTDANWYPDLAVVGWADK